MTGRPACIGPGNLLDAEPRLRAPCRRVDVRRAVPRQAPELARLGVRSHGFGMRRGEALRISTEQAGQKGAPGAKWRLVVSGATLGPWICRCKRVHNPPTTMRNRYAVWPCRTSRPRSYGHTGSARRSPQARGKHVLIALRGNPDPDGIACALAQAHIGAAHGRRADDDRLLPRGEPPREPRAREASGARAPQDQDGSRGRAGRFPRRSSTRTRSTPSCRRRRLRGAHDRRPPPRRRRPRRRASSTCASTSARPRRSSSST